jgi:hypothetical protein
MKTTAALLYFFAITGLFILSCKKDSFILSKDARITITADTIKYDTVFTQVGSVTQSFKIVNENDQKLRLSSVKLMGGANSNYKINVDGLAVTEATNVEIGANDSIYVFVQVNVDPNAANLPFILRDSIKVSYNGNDELVQLEAWGQNAHFLRNKEVLASETWTNDRPYVILGYLYVDINQTLSIEKGCRIYLHADAPVIIDGTLKVNGEKDSLSRVYFQGDRMDKPYRDYPAAWPGIYFRETSRDNVLNYAVIKNSFQAIAAEGPAPAGSPKLILNQCIIDNAYDAGIIALNSSIRATNCLISNCGRNINVGSGGDYEFLHCTIASVPTRFLDHKFPVVTMTDEGNNASALNAVFRNCILWGEAEIVENEVDIKKGAGGSVVFDNVLWRMNSVPAGITNTLPPALNNQSPQFDTLGVSENHYDFRLNTRNSPALDAGNDIGIPIDLLGNPRPVGLKPDLGCYEKQ